MTAVQLVASPCIGICVLDPATGFCRGCLRTGEEVAVWRDAADADRLAILRHIEARRRAGHTTDSLPVG